MRRILPERMYENLTLLFAVNMDQFDFYKYDYLGLKTLHDTGRLQMISKSGVNHLGVSVCSIRSETSSNYAVCAVDIRPQCIQEHCFTVVDLSDKFVH